MYGNRISAQTEPRQHNPPPVVESTDAVYYSLPVSKETKADALSKAVVFSNDQIEEAWHQSQLKGLQLISTNKEYRALPKSVWQSILGLHATVHQYTPEFFDCDSFSAVFMGWVIWNFEVNGVARTIDESAGHSYNAILVASDDGKSCSWSIVEPQADVIIEDPTKAITDNKDIYTATAGFAVTA